MSAIQEIFREYAGEYLRRFGKTMPANHKKVINAIVHCRDGAMGMHLYSCAQCGAVKPLPCSCGNRHCPTCQSYKNALWLHRRLNDLLPCSYFLITFTVPEPLRNFLRANQKVAYPAMFRAAWGALKKLARDQKRLGAHHLGAVAALHTWGRRLNYHPHLHFIVPGGGLTRDRSEWRHSRADFFVPVKAVSTIFRAKFRDAMEAAGLKSSIDAAVWKTDWVVHSEAVGDGGSALKYLAPYIFRVGISNSRIVTHHDGRVVLRYHKSGSARWRTMELDAMEFIRRFLQHVLPTGFTKIRHYGILNANAATPLQRVRELICVLYELVKELVQPPAAPPLPPLPCPKCGWPMRWIKFVPAYAASG